MKRCANLAAVVLLCASWHTGISAAGFQQSTASSTAAASSKSEPTSPPGAKAKLSIAQIVERLPRRVKSASGTPGDMVNLILVGSKEQMTEGLEAAGWVQVDRDAQDAILHAITEATEHRAYSEMPMSQLYLFGRPQDYGWAEGIPIHIVTERDHFRLWEAPWQTSDGKTVWVGAGTHDIDIEQDPLGQLTHKIDPDVDQERGFIAQSLEDAGKVQSQNYAIPSDPVQKAQTATGGEFHSDGRLAVIYLK